MGGKRVRHRSRRRAVLPLLALSLVAGVALAWGLGHLDRGQGAALVDRPDAASPSGPTATSAAASASSSPMTAAPVTPARRSGDQPEAPVQVRLPSGTTVPVVAVNTTADGVLDVPEDIRTAGWWRGGSRLGDPFGPTVIAAHIDSRTQGLGPYVELLSVAPDARIRVTSAHLVQHLPRGLTAARPPHLPGRGDRPLLGDRSSPTHDGHLCRALRRGPRRLPEPRRRHGPSPGCALAADAPMRRSRPSSRRALPHRMPPETHWRVVEPVDDLPPEPMSRAEPTAADPIEVAPDVTAPEWVDWVQQSVRRSREQGPPRSPTWPVTDPLADEPGGVRGVAAAPDWTVARPEAPDDTRRRARLKVLGVAAAAVLAVLLSVGTWWYVGRDDEGQQVDGPRAATRAAVAPGPAGPRTSRPGSACCPTAGSGCASGSVPLGRWPAWCSWRRWIRTSSGGR